MDPIFVDSAFSAPAFLVVSCRARPLHHDRSLLAIVSTSTMPTSCVVFGCASRWIKSEDDDQACLKFFAMPKDPERRKLWTNAINRKGWTAKDHHRVCSRHFIQGKPSRNPLHPDHIPALHMGGKEGEKSVGRGKGKLARFERTVERRQKESASFQVDLPPEDHRGYVDFSLVNERPKEWKRDHHVSFEPVDACVQTVVGFAHAADRLAQLEEENARLREKMEETSSTRTFGLHLICDSDRKTKFYTGLPTYAVFEALYTYLESEAATMTYWHGQYTPVSDAPRFARRKLTQKMELFAVLCRLRLGLAEEDIADRCGVHASTFSRIFRTWIRLMAVMLPNLFPWPSRETIDRYAPPHFRLTQRHESLLIVRNFTLNGQLL